MLALAEAFDNPLQIFFSRPVKQWFDAFLKVCSKNLRAVRKVVAKDTFFRAHLICGKKQKHYGDAHDQGQDDFQRRAQHDSLGSEEKYAARGWGAGGAKRKGIVCCRPEKKPERFVSTSSFLILGLRRRVQQCCCRHPNDIPRWLSRRRRACLQPWCRHQPGI